MLLLQGPERVGILGVMPSGGGENVSWWVRKCAAVGGSVAPEGALQSCLEPRFDVFKFDLSLGNCGTKLIFNREKLEIESKSKRKDLGQPAAYSTCIVSSLVGVVRFISTQEMACPSFASSRPPPSLTAAPETDQKPYCRFC